MEKTSKMSASPPRRAGTVMRTLILLRHAKSDRDSRVAEDYARPLSKRGRDAALGVGQWLERQHLRPEWVVCSPAARTREKIGTEAGKKIR